MRLQLVSGLLLLCVAAVRSQLLGNVPGGLFPPSLYNPGLGGALLGYSGQQVPCYPPGSSICGLGRPTPPLAPLNGACVSSMQCVGVAVCIQQMCQCPLGYLPLGSSCAFASVGVGAGVEQAFPALSPIAGPGYPVPIPGPGTLQPAYINPGAACAGVGGSLCGGGSFCYQGSCCCPQGYIVQQTACVVAPGPVAAAFPAVPPPPVVGAFGPAGFGGALIPPGLPCSGGLGCSGGAYCYQSVCCCPTGYVVQQQACVQQPFAVPAAPLGIPAPLGINGPFPGVVGGIASVGGIAPIGPGLPCGLGSMCGGGSFCYQSQCCCPMGYVVQQSSCIVQPAPVPLPAPLPLAPAPVAPIAPGLPCAVGSVGSFATCGGGSFCYQSQCCCPTGYIVQQSACVVAQAPFPATAPAGLGFGGLGPMGFGLGLGFGRSPFFGGPGFGLNAYGYGGAAGPLLPLGSPCSPLGGSGCGVGAWCMQSVCSCRSSYVPYAGGCMLKKRAKALGKDKKSDEVTKTADSGAQKDNKPPVDNNV